MATSKHAVLIAGGGPTGLMLAGSRVGGLLPRTIEILASRGIADRLLSQGRKHQVKMSAVTDQVTAGGPLRVFTLLHNAWPVLLSFGEPGGFCITPWADKGRHGSPGACLLLLGHGGTVAQVS